MVTASKAGRRAAPDDEHTARMGALFVGAVDATTQDEAKDAVVRAGSPASFCWDLDEARELLGEAVTQPPRCIFVDGRMSDLDRFVAWLRGEGHLFPVPVVVRTPALADHAFVEAHGLGADDALVRGDLEGVQRRVANLSSFDPRARPPVTAGRAVVAHRDEGRRRVLGRILRQAGFDVVFALDADDVEERLSRSRGGPAALLVLQEALPPDTLGTIRRARQVPGCAELPVIVLASENLADDTRKALREQPSAAMGLDGAPPDNLLFLANELLNPDVEDARASTRVLYETLCGFRVGGTLRPSYGLTYNISREGMYVRTLDPPPANASIWLELCPPDRTHVVHLRGHVVWSSGLQAPGGGAPPGFGLRISAEDSPEVDFQGYISGYEALL